jgi:hypothetical protein
MHQRWFASLSSALAFACLAVSLAFAAPAGAAGAPRSDRDARVSGPASGVETSRRSSENFASGGAAVQTGDARPHSR